MKLGPDTPLIVVVVPPPAPPQVEVATNPFDPILRHGFPDELSPVIKGY